MKCISRDFGEIEYTENDVIKFIQPPFGFEEYQNFVLIHDDEEEGGFLWLQSTDNPSLCFILLEGKTFSSFYNPETNGTTAFVICTIKEDIMKSTANLKSPILIDELKNVASQVILSDNYPVRHLIMGSEGEV